MSWLDATDWGATLRELGVRLEPRPETVGRTLGLGVDFSGTLDGKRVDVTMSGNSSSAILVSVPLDPALDAGLGIEPEGVLPRRAHRTGNAVFDSLFTVGADEPERVESLLTAPILDALVRLLQRSVEVTVRDDVVRVTGESEGWIRMALPLAVEVAHRIDDRRDGLQVPAPLTAHRHALGRFASDHLLRIDDTPIRIGGTADGVRVHAVLQREHHLSFTLRAALQLDDALNLDLLVSPATMLTPLRSLLPGQKDHRIGDREVDAAFHIRTSAPETLARALSPASRRALLACAAGARSFLLDDAGVTLDLDARPDAAHEPADRLRACLELLAGLSRAVRSGPASPRTGPFR